MNTDEITHETLERLRARALAQGCTVDALVNQLLDSAPAAPLPVSLFADMLDAVGDALLVFDLDLRYRYINPAYTALTGLSRDQVIGQTDAALGMPPPLVEAWRRLWEEVIATRQPGVSVFELRTPDGSRWLESRMGFLLNADGEIAYLLANVRDVTEQKQDEDMLSSVTKRLPGMLLRYVQYPDGSDAVTFISDSVQEIYGVTAEAALADVGIMWAKIHPDDIPAFAASVAASAADLSPWDYEWRILMDDGAVKWVNGRGTPQRTDDGGTMWNTLVLDITERKQAEQALRQSEAIYRLLFEESPIALWQQDYSGMKAYLDALMAREGIEPEAIQDYLELHPEAVMACLHQVNLLDTNRVGLATFGAGSVTEMKARFQSIINADPPQAASLAAIARGKTSFSGEFINYTLDTRQPRWVYLKWVLMPGYESSYERVLVAAMDITEQIHAESLRMEQELLKASLKKEKDFNARVQKAISALAHDLRTPLTMVASSKELLARYFDQLSDDQRRERLDNIGRQLKFALEMLDDTVTVVRGSLSEGTFNPAAVNLAVLCQLTLDEMRSLATPQHRLTFSNPQGITSAIVDETLVSRILINLISNAVKYSPGGGEINLRLDRHEDWIVLSVRDEGIGISPHALPHIFEPFYRSDEASVASGSGLGLSIVKECVRRHGGRITVESALGQGTRFLVELPVLQQVQIAS